MPRAVPTWADPDAPGRTVRSIGTTSSPDTWRKKWPTVTLGEFAVSEARSIRVDALHPLPTRPRRAPPAHGERYRMTRTPGETVVVMLDAASSTMGKETRILTWSFEAETGAWHLVGSDRDHAHDLHCRSARLAGRN